LIRSLCPYILIVSDAGEKPAFDHRDEDANLTPKIIKKRHLDPNLIMFPLGSSSG
jgi:hypothetical protein